MSAQPFDVVDFVVNQGHGVRGLSAMGLTQVPSNYLQPPEKQFDASKVVTDDSIPVIDVSNLDDLACTSICDAVAHHGFIQVVNHGIPLEVMEELQSAAHRFFEMPTSEKVKYKTDKFAGTRLGTSFSAANEKVLEWRDFLSFQYTTDEAASQTWPPIFKDEVLNYYHRLKVTVKKIYDVLLKGLNLETGFDESKESVRPHEYHLRQIKLLPALPEPEPDGGRWRPLGRFGLHRPPPRRHRRPLCAGPGWRVVGPRGPEEWGLVINVGDVLQIVSNGRYKSVEHKVVASESKNRVSVAVFVTPPLTHVVAPLEGVVETTGGQRMYRAFVYGDYIKELFGKATDGKATIDWAKM